MASNASNNKPGPPNPRIRKSNRLFGDADPFGFPIQRFSEALASGCEVYIGHMWNLSTLTVCAEQDAGRIDQMHERINTLRQLGQLKSCRSQPNVGELVMTQYGFYNDVFRAIVEETFEDGYVTVVFIDLGDKTMVPYDWCYELPEDISSEPFYGMIISLPGIPKEADSMLSDYAKKKLASKHEGGRVDFGGNFPKMVSVVSPQQVERYSIIGTSSWIRKAFKKVEWRDLIKWALSYEGYRIPMNNIWNPWSTHAMGLLSEICGGDQKELRLMVKSSLIEWSQAFYKPCYDAIKKYQVVVLSSKSTKLLNRDKFDELHWNDKIQGFHYAEKDIPLSLIPAGEEITVRIKHFKDASDWAGTIVTEPFATYRRMLCKILDEHCEAVVQNKKFSPEPGEFCLVYLHTWRNMDRMLRDVARGKWVSRPDRRHHTDDKEANHWYRAVCENPLTEARTFCRYYQFYLVDLGRYIVAPVEHALPGLLKFLLIPKLGIRGMFPVPAGDCSNQEINKSLYEKIRKGTELDVKVLEPEIHYKTAVKILRNEKSKSFHHLIKPAEPAPSISTNLTERLKKMVITLPTYSSMISPDDCFDQDEDDF